MLHLGPGELRRDPELTVVPATEKPTLAQWKYRACELSLFLSQWETPARHLISLSSSVHKVRLITLQKRCEELNNLKNTIKEV